MKRYGESNLKYLTVTKEKVHWDSRSNKKSKISDEQDPEQRFALKDVAPLHKNNEVFH